LRGLICPLFVVSCFGANLSVPGPRVQAFEARGAEYLARGPGYALSVNARAAILKVNGAAVTMTLAGADPAASLQPFDRMPGRANYLIGADIRASYDLFGSVRLRGAYPGIDVVFRANQQRLEYDFAIAPGRPASAIRLAFAGIGGERIDPDGSLLLGARGVTIHQPKPAAWQFIAGRRQPVDVSYWIDRARHVRFRIGAYDRRRALVIDPQIVFDKVFGGSGENIVAGLARDAQGALYVAGTTQSPDVATPNAAQAHLATAPLAATADAGKSWSYPATDGASIIYALAAAPSSPAVVYAAAPVGIFRSSDGGVTWSATAGAGLSGRPSTVSVDAASANTVYVSTSAGFFRSTDGGASWQPLTNGITGTGFNLIVADPSKSGTVFATLTNHPALYRSSDSGQTWTQLSFLPPDQLENPAALAIGSNGTVYLLFFNFLLISTDGGNTWATGVAWALNGPVFQNSQSLAVSPANPNTLFLANSSGVGISSDGGVSFRSVLPANFANSPHVVVDPGNPSSLYAADTNLLYRSTDGGQSWTQLALPYPLTPETLLPSGSRLLIGTYTSLSVFVTKWSADGSQILYTTYLGGTGGDQASAIAVDASGDAYVTGYTMSPDFPTTGGAFQTKLTTSRDVFAAKLSPDGSKLIYSTLFGSTNALSAAITVDSAGEAVLTGQTSGTFPTTPNAFLTTVPTDCNLQPTFYYTPLMGASFVTRLSPGGNALVYSTLFGASCATWGNAAALDSAGNVWIAGLTDSADLPVTSDALQSTLGGGTYDGFLARFSPSGHLDYASYLGGKGYDVMNAITLDQAGNIYITGESGGLLQPASANAVQSQVTASCPIISIGPSVPALEGNAVLLKLDPAARTVQRLTYLGAPLCLGGSSIAVDAAGEPWIAGSVNPNGAEPQTVSPFRIGLGAGFVSKFSADFTQLLFSTYFEAVSGLVLDSSGLAYTAGVGGFNETTGEQPAYVAKIDPAPPAISLDSVASDEPSLNPSNSQGIAPGEAIRLLGRNMGPAAAAPGIVVSGVLANAVSGVQVTFDEVPAPLLSVSAQEIDLIAPFELANKSSTTVQVSYNGTASNAVQVAVSPAEFQVLGVFNADFSVNSQSNPAPAGSVMILYVSGVGQTNPASKDGQVNAAPFSAFSMPVQVAYYPLNPNIPTLLPVTYAGVAPGLAAGIFQINFVAPAQSVMSVQVTSGNYASRFDVWVH